ncbi:MAG: glycosyltransferase family 39 protein, partial [Pseudomonadota bacterium]
HVGEMFQYGNRFLYSRDNPLMLLFCCRLMTVLLACLLGFAVYRTAKILWDADTAVVLLWVYCLSPNILAHARLATLDVGCAFLFFLSVILNYRLIKKGTVLSVIFSGGALGAALLGKFTGILLIPVIFIQAVAYLAASGTWRQWKKTAIPLAGSVVLGIIILNLSYGFSGFGSSLTDLDLKSQLLQLLRKVPILGQLPLPVPGGYLQGFDIAAFWNRTELYNIFLGKFYPEGGWWWYYFPVVLGLKLPLPFILGMVLSFIIWFRNKGKDLARFLFFAIPPLVLFLNFSLVPHRQLGLRYLLPLWPFMILLLGFLVDGLRAEPLSVRLGVKTLFVWYVLTSFSVYPNYLTYFNMLAGGSKNGWKWLADSNHDWGQDLPALARWQKHHDNSPLYLLYYGTAPPEAYGVRVQAWDAQSPPQYLAISTTSTYFCGNNPVVRAIIKDREPIARPGNTIHIYRIDSIIPP